MFVHKEFMMKIHYNATYQQIHVLFIRLLDHKVFVLKDVLMKMNSNTN